MVIAAAAAKSPSIWAEPGTLGFLVVFGMAVILYFVFRSMSRHLRRVREAGMAQQAEAGPGAEPDGGSPPGGLHPHSGNQSPGGAPPASADDDHERQQSEQNAAMIDLGL